MHADAIVNEDEFLVWETGSGGTGNGLRGTRAALPCLRACDFFAASFSCQPSSLFKEREAICQPQVASPLLYFLALLFVLISLLGGTQKPRKIQATPSVSK